MRASLALTALSLAFGGCLRDPAGVCEEGGPAFAMDPATGECFQFATFCDVPPGWSDCGGIEGEGEGEGEGEDCEDRGCPAGRACRDGECVAAGGECRSDEDCPETQHCDLGGGDGGDGAARPVPPKEDGKEAESEAEGEEGEAVDVPVRPDGVCQDNDYCWSDADCPDRHFCDPSAWAEGEAEAEAEGDAAPVCDPSECGEGEAEAESEGEPPAGLCRRGRRGSTGRACYAQEDCGDDRHACSSDWGVCCAEVQPGGGEGEAEAEPVCAGVCATLCSGQEDCADDERCNAGDVCIWNGDSDAEDAACQGFCVPAGCG